MAGHAFVRAFLKTAGSGFRQGNSAKDFLNYLKKAVKRNKTAKIKEAYHSHWAFARERLKPKKHAAFFEAVDKIKKESRR